MKMPLGTEVGVGLCDIVFHVDPATFRKRLRACVHADGQHFEHILRARVTVTNKSYGQIISLQVTQKDAPVLPNLWFSWS